MAFHETRFPVDISYGTGGGPGFDTSIIGVPNLYEQRNSRRADAQHVFDVGYGIKSWAQLATVKAFFFARRGALHGFRFLDFTDFATTENHIDRPDVVAFDDVEIAIGDGATTQFQLIKKYEDATGIYTRVILKPVAGTVLVGLNGVNQTTGWSVNTATGIITFSSAPADGDVITAGFEFDIPVRFGEGVDKRLNISIDHFDDGSITGIIVEELINELQVTEDLPSLGASDLGAITADATLSFLDGVVITISPASARNVYLPDYTDVALGGPYFVIVNAGVGTITILDHLSTTVATLLTGTAIQLWLGLDSFSTPTWYVI